MQKAITIKQPWASLIVLGANDIENRTWYTKFRGRVFVHASAQWYPNSIYKTHRGKHVNPEIYPIASIADIDLRRQTLNPEFYPLSAIIGEVEIVDCVQNHESIWAVENHWHWVLANPIEYKQPIPCKGALSFWTPPAETLALCEEMRELTMIK